VTDWEGRLNRLSTAARATSKLFGSRRQ